MKKNYTGAGKRISIGYRKLFCSLLIVFMLQATSFAESVKTWDYVSTKDIQLYTAKGNEVTVLTSLNEKYLEGKNVLEVYFKEIDPAAVEWAVQLSFVYQGGFKAGHIYEVSIPCKGTMSGRFTMSPALNVSPWTNIGVTTSFNVTTEWKDIKITIAPTTDQLASLALPRMMLAKFGAKATLFFGPATLSDITTKPSTENKIKLDGSVGTVVDEVADKCMADNQTEIYIPSVYKDRLPTGKFSSVKIPGLEEQTKAARASGKQYWKAIGPGFINVPLNIYMKGKRILVQTDWGISESIDEGANWRSISYSLYSGITSCEQRDFDVSPSDPKLIISAGRMLYRTEDGGKTWSEIQRGLPKPIGTWTLKYNEFRQVKFNSDGSRIFACSANETEPWMTMSKEQLFDTKVIFVGDGRAQSFRALNLKRPYASITRVYVHPSNPNIVLFSFKDGEFFITRNARAATPDFEQVAVPTGLTVVDMCVKPDNPNEMLATLVPLVKMGYKLGNSAEDGKSRLYEVKGITAGTLSFLNKPILDASGKPCAYVNNGYSVDIQSSAMGFRSISINRKNPNQIFIGVYMHLGGILVSDDNCKSFRLIRLADKYYIDSPDSYGWIHSVWTGDSQLMITSSRMGAWSTRDGFKTVTPLFLNEDESGRWRGNRGVAASACISGIAISKNGVQLGIQDHRIWGSDGTDLSRWEELAPVKKFSDELKNLNGKNDFQFILKGGIYGSPDGKYLYAVPHHNWGEEGKTRYFLKYEGAPGEWRNFTPALGLGEGDHLPKRGSAYLSTRDAVCFNSANSKEQWFVINNGQILYTPNGGNSYIICDPKFSEKYRSNQQSLYISCIFYDPTSSVLYLSLSKITKSPNSVGLAPLYRSFDKGITFEPFEIGVNNITSLTVTANGNLIVGTVYDGVLPGQLIVLPNADPAKKEVKCTIGDTIEELSVGQVMFNNIASDGNDIVAVANWQGGVSRHIALGPLLSTDGGNTFKWIRYNLNGTGYDCVAIGRGIIIIGDPANNSVYKYKESEFKLPGQENTGI